MSDQTEAAGTPQNGFLRRFWRISSPFFAGGRARLLVVGLLLLTFLQIGIQVRFNLWNRDFFNALEARDRAAFFGQMWLFMALAGASMATAVYQLYVKQLLQLRWREWLTDRLVADWLRDGRHYQLGFTGDPGTDNPDQRIAEDAHKATEMAVDFAVGILNATVMLIAFIGILWTLSGPLVVSIGTGEISIPGYMVFAALLYALAGSTATWLVGRPMVDINIRRNGVEGDFRFGLVRLRESSEGVALIRGEEDERRGLKTLFGSVAVVSRQLMGAQRRLMWLTSAYGMIGYVFPTLVAAPRYFAGAITLGGLMQIGGAFHQVQGQLNWLVDNFPKIAEWRGSVERVLSFHDAIGTLDELNWDPAQDRITMIEGPTGAGDEVLAFKDLRIDFADGNVVIAEAAGEIHAGERVLIKGESGTGKSTLFRAVGGLWPWGAGEIRIPPRDGIMFMPQRPYLPLGTLRQALSYPHPPKTYSDTMMKSALAICALEHFADRLDVTDRWDRTMSLGEQQRLAFARMLLQKRRWVFMDEATAALDETNQERMMGLFVEALPKTAVISIGHRPGLEAFHDRTVTLVKRTDGARLALRPRPVRVRRGGRLGRLVGAFRGRSRQPG